MDAREFRGKCSFYLRGNTLHGKCSVRLPDRRIAQIATRPGEGVDLSSLTHDLAKRNLKSGVAGFWGDAFKAARGAATSVAKGKVARTLHKRAVSLASQSLAFAQTPEAQMALSFIPGGQAVAMGTKAANLIHNARKGNPNAKARIAAIVKNAREGDPRARVAARVIQNIYRLGKGKGAWGGVSGMPTGNEQIFLSGRAPGNEIIYMSGFMDRYQRGQYPVAFPKSPNALYALAVNR